MITIDKDPAQFVPDVCESDLYNKIVMIKCYNRRYLSDSTKYYAILKYDAETLYWFGSRMSDNYEPVIWPVIWFGYYGNTLIKFLIDTWNKITEYDKIIYVIENTDELLDILYKNSITGQAFDTIVSECKKVIQ